MAGEEAESPGLAILQSDPRPASWPQSLRVAWWWAGEVTSQGRAEGTLPPSPGKLLTLSEGCCRRGCPQSRPDRRSRLSLSRSVTPAGPLAQFSALALAEVASGRCTPPIPSAACVEGPCRWECGPWCVSAALRPLQAWHGLLAARKAVIQNLISAQAEMRGQRSAVQGDAASGQLRRAEMHRAELASLACLPRDSVTSSAPKSGPQHSEELASRPPAGGLCPPRPPPASALSCRAESAAFPAQVCAAAGPSSQRPPTHSSLTASPKQVTRAPPGLCSPGHQTLGRPPGIVPAAPAHARAVGDSWEPVVTVSVSGRWTPESGDQWLRATWSGRRLRGELEDRKPREGLCGEEGVCKGPGAGATASSGDKQAGGW